MSHVFPGVHSTYIREDTRREQPLPSSMRQEKWEEMFETQNSTWTREGHICPDCDTDASVETHDDEVVCNACGTHLGYLIDNSAEYRWFGSDDRSPDPTRVGNPMNPLLPESSLGTRILVRPGDNKAMRRIYQYHLWNIMPYRERTLWNVFDMLQNRASAAGVSNAVMDETKQLYAQVSPLCICRGQQKDALIAACLYESLKRHDTPRRPVEIADIFQIDVKLITRGVKQFSGLLEKHLHTANIAAVAAATATAAIATPAGKMVENLNVASVQGMKSDTPSTNFRHYLEPAIYKLETPRAYYGQTLEFATKIGSAIDELGICPETTPSSLAASALALTCDHFKFGKTNAEVAKVCSISAATLQKCLKRIEPWKPVLFKRLPATK
jgi:transcription initiation factor TFIIIB Brf1 subunit/transcription initiation factor TFIIB